MQRFLPLALFVVLIVTFRWVGSVFSDTFPNFQPLAALFFCAAILLKGWRAWAIPLAVWLATYPIPAIVMKNGYYLSPEVMITTALAFGAVFFLGKSMASSSIIATLAGSVVAALIFHLITNGAAWIGNPVYPKNLEGLVQSLWTGPVGSPLPSWVFLRNMVAANLLFTAIFLCTRFALPKISAAPIPSEVR